MASELVPVGAVESQVMTELLYSTSQSEAFQLSHTEIFQSSGSRVAISVGDAHVENIDRTRPSTSDHYPTGELWRIRSHL